MTKPLFSIKMIHNQKIAAFLALGFLLTWLTFLYHLLQNSSRDFDKSGFPKIPNQNYQKTLVGNGRRPIPAVGALKANTTDKSLFPLQATTYLRVTRPLFFTGDKNEDSIENNSATPPNVFHNQTSGKNKLVLFYTRYRGNTHWMAEHMTNDGIMYSLNTNVHSCPFNCTFTHEKRLADRSDAIVFSIIDNIYFPESPLYPKYRQPDQVWIAYSSTFSANEDKPNSRLDKMDSVFNWTASYRLDSDIYWPYGYFYNLPTKSVNSTSKYVTEFDEMLRSNGYGSTSTLSFFKRRQKLIASMITSKCTTKSFREGIISELQTYIDVDIYGACGSHKCPHTLEERDPCLKHIGNHYKFYLAFENALCEDYITDEFFAAFEHGMVPVTYGLGDYTQVAPHHSYINMLDFPSVKHLANYLLHLSSHEEEYMRYFEWKWDYGIEISLKYPILCGLCLKLWELDNNKKNRKVCKSFKQWWNRKRSPDWGNEYFRNWFLNSQDKDAACKYFLN